MIKLYRFKGTIGVRGDLKLGINALKVLDRRYPLRDEGGHIIETPTSLFQRAAHTIASADTNFDPAADVSSLEQNMPAAAGTGYAPFRAS